MFFNKYSKLLVTFTLSFFVNSLNINSLARENPAITIGNSVASRGCGYWQSSTIREWLNSSEERVMYTSNRPSKENAQYHYDKESGFLSNFTEEEQEAIAVTKRRVFTGNTLGQYPDGGNKYPKSSYLSRSTNNAMGDLINNWKDYYYQIVLDKVFFLNTAEYFYYLESRGFEEPKTLREEARIKHNFSSKHINWYLNQSVAGDLRSDGVWVVCPNQENKLIPENLTPRGIVPAMHIKPGYVFSNGKTSEDIEIGSEVCFGKYNEKDIVWNVINKTRDGHVLLLSKEILDIKSYSSKNNLNVYKYSEYVNFELFDVDTSNDLQVSALRNDDIELPQIEVLNEEILFERQLSEFDLIIKPSDNIGVEYVLLPNGNKVYSMEAINYTVVENGDYFIDIKDVSGNYRQYKIPIHNINMPSKVEILSSSSGWTNKDVSVSISSTNSNLSSYKKETTSSKRDTFLNEWSTGYNSLKGRAIHITGNVELESYNKPLGSVSTGIGLYYNTMTKVKSGDIILNKAITYPKRWKLSDLELNGKQHFDIVTTIPNTVNNYFHPFFQIDTYDENAYSIKWTDVNIELVNKDEFGIEKILLPNGNEIYEKSYIDVITKEGSYTYRVYDSNGIITEKEVDVLIDKDKPNISVQYDDSSRLKKLGVATIRASDSKSGVKKIVFPNGEEVIRDTATYNITSNGMFTFKVYDNAGNINTKTINVTNIDNQVSDIIINKNEEILVNNSVEVKISSTDPSGIKYIELPDKTKVFDNKVTYTAKENGVYRFLICDNLDNKEIVYVTIDSIDDKKPILKYTKNEEWTNEGICIDIDVLDI